MSEGYVKRLLNPADTLGVLRELPLRTNNHFRERLAPTNRITAGGVVQNYEHVPAANRISFFDLRVLTNPCRHLSMHVEEVSVSATFRTGTVWKTWKTLRPCYYLPFRRGGTTRMKLSPPDGYTGDDILFFATATIDGCSVYVEGPGATPKVSHLNAANIAPAPAMGMVETDQALAIRIALKTADMNTRINNIRKAPVTVVQRSNYIVDATPVRTGMRQQFADSKRIPLALVTNYQPFGAVVGVFSAGSWKFFLQKNVSFDYRMTPTSRVLNDFKVVSANEFWPTNSEGFRILH